MILYDPDQTKVIATKLARRPRFAFHRGRTWQWGNSLKINGKLCNYTYDNSWGSYWYFEYNRQWYKVHMWDKRKKGYGPFYEMEFVTVPPNTNGTH